MAEVKRRWTLAYLNLVELPGDLVAKYGRYIEELDLSNNRLSDLRFLMDFPQVTTVILDHNNISCHAKFPLMPELTTLWVNNNKIKNLGVFIATVAKSCPNLRIFSMMNNAAAPSYFNGGTYMQYVDFRYYVVSQIPTLRVLDDKHVTPEERAEAERIYIRPVRRNKRPKSSRPSSRRRSGCWS